MTSVDTRAAIYEMGAYEHRSPNYCECGTIQPAYKAGYDNAMRDIKELRDLNVKRFRQDANGYEVEFFPPAQEPMALDPKSLAKTLTDSMPPDSAMLFASTDEPILNPSEGNATDAL